MKKYLAEFTGTFGLVFLGTGAIAYDSIKGTLGNPGIALAFGLAVASMIFMFARTSGAHLNPAVTLVFYLRNQTGFLPFFLYLLSQFLGAVSASIILHFIFPSDPVLGNTIPHGSMLQSFIVELFLTFILLFTILYVAEKSKTVLFSSLLIGFVIFAEAYLAGPVSGASMNPFRSLAPALVTGDLQYTWIYMTAPVSGALLALGAWYFIRRKAI